MVRMKSAWAVGVLVAVGITSGCGRIGDSSSSTSYNQLVDKYNKLLDSSYKLQERTLEEESDLADLNQHLETYSRQMEDIRSRYLARASGTLTSSEKLDLDDRVSAAKKTQGEVYQKLTALEGRVLKQAAALDANSDNVYKDPEVSKSVRNLRRTLNGLSEAISGKSKALNGIRNLV